MQQRRHTRSYFNNYGIFVSKRYSYSEVLESHRASLENFSKTSIGSIRCSPESCIPLYDFNKFLTDWFEAKEGKVDDWFKKFLLLAIEHTDMVIDAYTYHPLNKNKFSAETLIAFISGLKQLLPEDSTL